MKRADDFRLRSCSLRRRWRSSVVVAGFLLVGVQLVAAQAPDLEWRRVVPLGYTDDYYYTVVVERFIPTRHDRATDRWSIEKRNLETRQLVEQWLLRESHYRASGDARAPDLSDVEERVMSFDFAALLVEEAVRPLFPARLADGLELSRSDRKVSLRWYVPAADGEGREAREALIAGGVPLSRDESLPVGISAFYRGGTQRALLIHQGETAQRSFQQFVLPFSEARYRTILYLMAD